MIRQIQRVLIFILNIDGSLLFFYFILFILSAIHLVEASISHRNYLGSSLSYENHIIAWCVFAILLLYFLLIWFTSQEVQQNIFKPIRLIKIWLFSLLVAVGWVVVLIECQPDKTQDRVADLFAVVGTLISVVSWREAYEQNREITNLSRSLPTRYVGVFPEHLGEIMQLVNAAKRRVCILTDCVDYGSFSDPQKHELMIQAIESRSKQDVNFDILINCKPSTVSYCSPFYPRWKNGWSLLFSDPIFQPYLEKYFEANPHFSTFKPMINGSNNGRQEFNRMLDDHHKLVTTRLRKNSNIQIEDEDDSDDIPAMFFWLADDLEAVFLLSHTASNVRGLAFRTRDAHLLGIFKSTFQMEWEKAKSKKKS